jgi:hypothetical protein
MLESRMKGAGHVGYEGNEKYKILARYPKGKRQFGKPKHS